MRTAWRCLTVCGQPLLLGLLPVASAALVFGNFLWNLSHPPQPECCGCPLTYVRVLSHHTVAASQRIVTMTHCYHVGMVM